MGSVRPGVPTLTVALRGMAGVIVEVRTLAGPKHSGQFGGAAPDALIVLLHALAALHDEHGDVDRRRACAARSGRARRTATRSSASWPRSLPGMPLFGTGGLGERVWSGPAITVTGIDVLPVDRARERGRAVRARQDQPARPSRAGPGRGAGRAGAAPRGLRPFGDRAHGARRGDRQRASPRRPAARPTRRRATRSRRRGAARPSRSRRAGRSRS